MKEKIRIFLVDRRYSYIAFIIIFIFCCVYAVLRGPIVPIYDSSYYCTIANGVISKTGMHLNLFPKTFRGCLLPIFIQVLNKLPFGLDIGWKLIGSFVSSELFANILPRIITGNIINNAKKMIRSILLACIYIYLWGDFITYPLSDLIAFFFMAIGVLCCREILEEEKVNKSLKYSKFFIFGAVSYVAYNTRCTYLYGIVILTLMIVAVLFSKKKIKILLIGLITTVIGMFVISVPQCLVNINCEGVFSPKVYTENYNSDASNLQMQQIVWGLNYPRYETYIGADSEYPSPGVFFVDQTGQKLVEKELISEDTFSFNKWVELVIHYPLDILSIYTRHLINAMTPLWNRVYIGNINTNKLPIICISLLIWFVCALEILRKCILKNINWITILLVTMTCIPAFMQIMGAVEIRFFLPAYIFAYGYVATGIDYSGLRKWCSNKWLSIILILVVVFNIWLTVISSTLANNVERTLLINDKGVNAEIERVIE